MAENLLAPIDAIESIAKTLEDNRGQLAAAPADRRSEISRWCAGLGDVTERIAQELFDGGRVPETASAVDTYYATLPDVLGGVLPPDTVDRLGQRLASARDPERYSEILAQADTAGEVVKTPAGRVEGARAEIAHLAEAAEIFRVVARSVGGTSTTA